MKELILRCMITSAWHLVTLSKMEKMDSAFGVYPPETVTYTQN